MAPGVYQTTEDALVVSQGHDIDLIADTRDVSDRVIIACVGPAHAARTCNLLEVSGGRLRLSGLALVQLSHSNITHALFARDDACVELRDVTVFSVCSSAIALVSSRLTCRHLFLNLTFFSHFLETGFTSIHSFYSFKQRLSLFLLLSTCAARKFNGFNFQLHFSKTRNSAERFQTRFIVCICC